MNKPTIEHIIVVMREAGMKVFDTPYSVTLGGIRTKDNSSNKFNDWLFALMFTPGGGIMSVVMEGTVDAGRYYRENPINIEGTAIIMDGVQHLTAYRYENPKKNEGQHGHRGQEAFSQIGDMKYWRDNDRDKEIDREGPVHEENARTNGHDMGTVGENVNKWSAGCWGSIQKNMELLFSMAELQIENGLGDTFSYAMLHEDMF